MGSGTQRRCPPSIDRSPRRPYEARRAQVAELVDALVSGTSGASREGSSPFLGTILTRRAPWRGGRPAAAVRASADPAQERWGEGFAAPAGVVGVLRENELKGAVGQLRKP